jgi:hypothetical protein
MTSSEDAPRTVLNIWLTKGRPVNVRLTVESGNSVVLAFEGDCLLQDFSDTGIDFGARPYWGMTITFDSTATGSIASSKVPGKIAVVIRSGPITSAITGDLVPFSVGPA